MKNLFQLNLYLKDLRFIHTEGSCFVVLVNKNKHKTKEKESQNHKHKMCKKSVLKVKSCSKILIKQCSQNEEYVQRFALM